MITLLSATFILTACHDDDEPTSELTEQTHDTVFRTEHCRLRDRYQGRTAEERTCHRLHFLNHEQGECDRTQTGTRPVHPRHADVL